LLCAGVGAVLLVRHVGHFVTVRRVLGVAGDVVTYVMEGELFFASSNDLTTLSLTHRIRGGW
jgi:SulP family sulfate permease